MAAIMKGLDIERTLRRMTHEIIESHVKLQEVVLVGIKTRGEYLAKRIAQNLFEFEKISVPCISLDISLYRDDLSYISDTKEPQVQKEPLSCNLNNKVVIIVDDVLYTGRTVRAALDAILTQTRPQKIQLAILVDRGHRELPIRADYVGKNIPTSKKERVRVQVKEVDGTDQVEIIE
ncbi:bifunctional pyr operon transcriptional regulator/uracil phosphoribosyltransferase PyrR [Dolosicoccus paucivorans]|uniref:bifunctional pyr operon transcriptional regulator/uracil phosphoribosyltransferase PyrR n=1 Tax=Dolosicoccus paucivorans TaxID=84521 RepID=UPI0008875987|nr:bifunctional pyr operon transcriptional regulator/uracil phosphoribosyltransferase PyrR [Dolosicoccus paucivorans]PMB84594.1 bifunctional pyr operon transcriptional regulator/uracil phosphoribosyltransferase PyrR [Dolosicoccus paucivorans]SDI94231.1 pyrimidine operon attenuation protein / uracil phosphoribosyltransferase [Dolosicoccus paucivorans]